MPELPEVETIRRTLEPSIVGKTIEKIEVFNPVVLENVSAQEFISIEGAVVNAVRRRGKYLIIELEKNGETKQMVAHMRMTGKLLFAATEQPPAKHRHLRFVFDDGSELNFEDTRRFGRFWLVGADELDTVSGLNTLGPEPISDDFSCEYWEKAITKRGRTLVKAALLDQHLVAGLGNIYADEVLFAAGVYGGRKVSSLTHEENEKLCSAMRDILNLGIEKCGTSFSDYVDSNNEKGDMISYLQVYLQEGKKCSRCGGTIKRTKLVGRSSYYCPDCQPE